MWPLGQMDGSEVQEVTRPFGLVPQLAGSLSVHLRSHRGTERAADPNAIGTGGRDTEPVPDHVRIRRIYEPRRLPIEPERSWNSNPTTNRLDHSDLRPNHGDEDAMGGGRQGGDVHHRLAFREPCRLEP